MTIRMIVIPLFIILNSNYSVMFGIEPSEASFVKANLLIVHEYLIITFFLMKTKILSKCNTVNHTTFLKNKFILALGVIGLCILNLIVSVEGIKGISRNFIFSALFLLAAVQINKLYKKKNRESLKIYFILAVILYVWVSISNSRWNILIIILSSSIIYKYIFGEIKKSQLLIMGIIFVVSFYSISFTKFEWALKSSENKVITMTELFTEQVQDYFSGPTVIAQTLEFEEIFKSKVTAETFFNDYLGSVPVLSQYINQENRVNYIFNYQIFGEDGKTNLIMPMVSIGYVYFGFLLSPIMSLLCAMLAIGIEKKLEDKAIEFKFIFMRMILFLSMYGGFNSQIMFGNFISYTILIFIVLIINEKVCIKGEKVYGKV